MRDRNGICVLVTPRTSLAAAHAETLEALLWAEINDIVFRRGGGRRGGTVIRMAQIGKGVETIEVAQPALPTPVVLPAPAPAPTHSGGERERELQPVEVGIG